jgi:hypothetical protein
MKTRGEFFIVLAILIISQLGCASYQSKVISASPIENYALGTKNYGISFAADPFDTSEKAKDAFYADITSRGYYPVQLIFKNDTSDKVMVLRETVELESGGSLYRPVRSSNMFNDFEHNKMAYALLGFGIFSYMSAEEANRKMETDWREKEMPEQLIVLPGRTAHGFVYFKLPQGTTLRGGKLKVEAEKMGEKKAVQLELTL